MIDIVDRLKFDATRCEIQFSKGVAGNISEAAKEIDRLRALILDACTVFDHYDLPEHGFHYRRAVKQANGKRILDR